MEVVACMTPDSLRFLPLHDGMLASYVVRPSDYFHFNRPRPSGRDLLVPGWSAYTETGQRDSFRGSPTPDSRLDILLNWFASSANIY